MKSRPKLTIVTDGPKEKQPATPARSLAPLAAAFDGWPAWDRWRQLPPALRDKEAKATAALLAPSLPCGKEKQLERCVADGAAEWCPSRRERDHDKKQPWSVFHALKIKCPHDEAVLSYRERLDRITKADLPLRFESPLLGLAPQEDFGGLILADDKVTPLIETPALAAVRAFNGYERNVIITLASGKKITYSGHETILVLGGPPGTGKSLAAAFGLSENDGRWSRAADLCTVGCDYMEIARTDGWLVIDDLGVEHAGASGYALGVIDAVIGRRYDDGRTTIVTTNLSLEDIGARYGRRVLDRLDEAGLYVACTGPSLRGRAK